MALNTDPNTPRVVLGFAALFLSYGLGQALTDVFQTDTDSISSPYRPLVRGEISRRDVLLVSLSGLLLCGLALALLSSATLVLSVVAILGLATYTPLKRRWWGGPPWNSWIVALLPANGFLAAGATPRAAIASPALPLVMGSVFFTYAIFVIIGYLKDVEADRATGYRTLAVRFGRRAAVAVSSLCLAAGMACSLRLLATTPVDVASVPAGIALVFWAGGALALSLAHTRGYRVSRDDQAHPAVALSVRGYLALHLGECVWLRPGLAVPALLLWGLFETALIFRPSRSQI
jgi:4-hydroxybenzoate polyprenyltransferase